MKLFLCILAMLMPSAAFADVWRDENKLTTFQNDPKGGFLLSNSSNGVSTHCEVTEWPIENPEGTMVCGGIREVKIEIMDKRTVIIDGVRLSKDY